MRIWQQRAEREGSSERETEREREGGEGVLEATAAQTNFTVVNNFDSRVERRFASSSPLLLHAALIRHVGLSKSVTQCTRAELTDNYFSALVRCRPRCELYSVMHMDVDVNVDVNVNVSACVHVDIFRVHSSVHSHIHFATYSIFYAALRRFCGNRARVRVQLQLPRLCRQQFLCINSEYGGCSTKITFAWHF